MSDRVERSKKNIIWTFVGKIVNLLFPFITQTCLIYILGVQYIGLDGLFKSVLMILSLTELGIGSALVFSMYKPIADGDDEKVCALLAFYKKCYHVIGSVILVLGLALLPFIQNLISGEVPDDINIYVLYSVYLLNTVLSYYLFAYKTSLLNACQMVDMISRVDIVANSAKCILQCVGLLLLPSYYMFVWVIPLSTVLRNLFVEYVSRKKYPQYVCRGKLPVEDIHVIKDKVKGLFFQSIGNVVLFAVDNIVISAFLGLKLLGKYNNYLYIHNALVNLVGVISFSIIPVIGNSIATETREKNYMNFRQFNLLWLCLISWCAICQMCLLQPFVEIWAGKDLMLDNRLAFLFVIYFYTNKMGDMSHNYKTAAGIWKEARYVPLISSAVNLCLNLLLVNEIGLAGILISTIVSLVFVNVPFGGRVLFKVYFNYKGAWRRYLLTHLLHFLLTFLIGGFTYWICSRVPVQGVGGLVLRVLVCVPVPAVLLFLVYRKDKRLEGTKILLRRFIRKGAN